MVIVEPGNPRDRAATELLQKSHALMERLFPPEDNYYLSIEALCGPDIRFFVAREQDRLLGCGALAIKPDYGEVKSMFTAETGRGRGVASAVLRMIEDTAREAGLPVLKLETGNLLAAAHRLYLRHGFTPCPAFGSYEENATSLFMSKTLHSGSR